MKEPRLIVRRPVMRAAGVLLLYALFHLLWRQAAGSWLHRAVVDQATVAAAAGLINVLTPRLGVFADGTRIVGPVGALAVQPGCDGTEALFLLGAAFLAYPQPLLRRATGMLLGVVIVYLLNLLRLVALFYAAWSEGRLFELLHGYVAPTLLLVLATLFFSFWVSTHPAVTSGMSNAGHDP